ncbi:unnamed protein product [Linum trigynum]|uniref:F-box protein At4g22030 n=1 Tax=Linum trigynum TaxID=586398 RepID=A0AAV2GSQ2_9ROSI
MACYSSIRTISSTSPFSNPPPRAAAISVPKLPIRISLPKFPTSSANQTRHLTFQVQPLSETIRVTEHVIPTTTPEAAVTTTSPVAAELYYAVLESIADRIEMHGNVAVQRDNWNSLLLSSINMSILAATTMAAVSPSVSADHSLPLALGSTILFAAATGLLAIMNTIQPSQLAEEQRNAARLFRQLHSKLNGPGKAQPTKAQVEDAVEKVLAIDRAYPLPLLGKMIPKFPTKFQPAVWWPRTESPKRRRSAKGRNSNNGWSEELEAEMREVSGALKSKDKEDYEKLGSLMLKINKTLAVSGPVLSGVATAASAMGLVNGSNNGWAAAVAVAAGAMATAVNTLEHGGQIGMVVEMYRNCAGFFNQLEESIDSTLGESGFEERENGEVFAMKVGLALGRSPAEVRELAGKCAYSREEGTPLEEFTSKLF